MYNYYCVPYKTLIHHFNAMRCVYGHADPVLPDEKLVFRQTSRVVLKNCALKSLLKKEINK